MLIFFKNESGGLVLVINMNMNLVYGIYMAHSKAFKKRILNYQDFFNELIVAASTYWMVLYTDIILKLED